MQNDLKNPHTVTASCLIWSGLVPDLLAVPRLELTWG